jgi:DNA adenine methylase
VAASFSPLRYPGGKQILARVLAHLVKLNGCEDGTYVEPYAGGAGAALALLYGEHVRTVIINDADSRVFAFWDAALNRTEELVRRIRETPLSVEEWQRQRQVYLKPEPRKCELGFRLFTSTGAIVLELSGMQGSSVG